MPASPNFQNTEAFVAALETIKESNPEVTPLYTNYAAGWTLSNWDFTRTGVSGDPDMTTKLAEDSAPFEEGDTMYTIYDVLYQVAEKGLIEARSYDFGLGTIETGLGER